MTKGCANKHTVVAGCVVGALLLLAPVAEAQAVSACDLNADGRVDSTDVTVSTNMALNLTPCTANVISPGVCDIVVIQRIVNAALGGACVTGSIHTVTLNWTASTSSNVIGYNVYRSSQANGPFTK